MRHCVVMGFNTEPRISNLFTELQNFKHGWIESSYAGRLHISKMIGNVYERVQNRLEK